MEKKKPPLTKGNGEPVKMPKPKHIQVLRGLAIKVLHSTVPEYEYVNNEKIPYLYGETLNNAIIALNYDPKNLIPQMIKEDYLVVRTTDPDQVSFYIMVSKKAGQNLRIALKGKAA
jgi:hypothetical protein